MTTATFTCTATRPGDDDYESLFEVNPDGTTVCTLCESLNSLDDQSHPSMAGAGTDASSRCTVCGSYEVDADPFNGTRVIARRDDPRTLADIEHGYDHPEWGGYGYLNRRSEALHSTDPETPSQPERVTEADTWLLTEANRQGFTADELFRWLNSKMGRYYGDLWFGGTAATGYPIEALAREMVHRITD